MGDNLINAKCKMPVRTNGLSDTTEISGICCIKTDFDGCNDQSDCCGRKTECNNNQCVSTKKEYNTEANDALVNGEQTDTITFLGIKNVDPTIVWVICALIFTFTVLLCIGFYLCVYKKQDEIFHDQDDASFSSSKEHQEVSPDIVTADIEMEALGKGRDEEEEEEDTSHYV